MKIEPLATRVGWQCMECGDDRADGYRMEPAVYPRDRSTARIEVCPTCLLDISRQLAKYVADRGIEAFEA